MIRTYWICACLSCLLLSDIVCSEWVYPELTADEGPLVAPEVYLNQIQSNNDAITNYALSGEGADNFKIYSTGKIYLIQELDREMKDEYTLSASALDESGNKVDEDAEITIRVSDINDNYPIFVTDSLSGSVAEAATTSDGPFMTVSATDADDPNKFFSKVVYSIKNNSDSPQYSGGGNRFSISETGQVSVQGTLDYEVDPIVSFTVVAMDGGGVIPGLETSASVTVTIVDSNDHAPVFDSTTMPATRYLSELSPVGTPLYNIHASDEDVGVNKKVYFDITSGNTGRIFEIISIPSETSYSLGALQLRNLLDYESGTTEYTLIVRAYNKEALNKDDSAYQTTSTLTIHVTDANEPPVFIDTPYTAIVSEGDDSDLGEPAPIGLTVIAEDYDFKRNQTVSYSMHDPEGWFQVNSKTGEVSRIAKVDREADAVQNGIYILKVSATDNYDHGDQASGNADISITITDVNDNPPSPDWGTTGSTVTVCNEPVNDTVYTVVAKDPDSAVNGPPFIFRLEDVVDSGMWGMETVDSVSARVFSRFEEYGLSGSSEEVLLPFTITDNGSPLQTGTSTLTVSVCHCDNGAPTCNSAVAAGFPVVIIIAIIAVLLLIIILIFALIAYKRRQDSLELKEPFFDDEDDVRETVQVYQEEGGEEDQDAYDLSALRAPLMEDPNQPVRIEKPLQQPPRAPRGGHIPDDIGDYIGDAKDQADADPSAPPFDSLLVFDYEGQGSDAGSLSSINTATTDGSMDYDYLNNWGPRFKRLADMYNDGSESE